MTAGVQVRAPCRLHFGMFSFGHADRAQYGGVGVMVEPPGVTVTLRAAEQFGARGEHAERVREFVERIVARWGLEALPACEITAKSPPDHVGLGVGSQLGLAVAAGVRRFLRLADASVEELATAVGRAARSAVGTYGFRHGGLIVDAGKKIGESVGKLQSRVALPDAWRFVLLRQT
ncbi:MAG TPA: hypothetical protein VFW73_05850, partial [Lacipirellulaceae bacterium]|nr:hypothetical protein [Lacipirellulaceae bacterium]